MDGLRLLGARVPRPLPAQRQLHPAGSLHVRPGVDGGALRPGGLCAG